MVVRVFDETGHAETRKQHCWWCGCGSGCRRFSVYMLLLVVLIGLVFTSVIFGLSLSDPIVCVTIDLYKGMPKNESNTTFSPEFNITMYGKQGHVPKFLNDEYCYGNGGIHILYQGFSIATGPIVKSCLLASNGRTVMLFAWGQPQNMPLPLYLENRLRDEMQHGAAVLQAEIDFDDKTSFSCWPVIGSKNGYSRCS